MGYKLLRAARRKLIRRGKKMNLKRSGGGGPMIEMHNIYPWLEGVGGYNISCDDSRVLK